MSSPTGALRNLALAVGSLWVLLLCLELLTRLFLPAGYWRHRDAAADWQLDSELGWVNRPNLDTESRDLDWVMRYRTNPDGLVPAESRRERKAGVLRIMVFGDSMVVGRSVPQDEIYTARLEERLRERGIAAEVINAGVQGYSTDQALLLMERLLPLYRPNVVLFGSTLNDFGGNELSHANGQAKARFLLIGDTLEFIPPQVADEIRPIGGGPRVWIQRSAFYRAIQPRLFTLRARYAGWRERNLMGLMLEIYVNRAALEKFDWRLFEALVERMQRSAKAAGARFFLFSHPEIAEVWPPYIEMARRELGPQYLRYEPLAAQRRVEAAAKEAGVEYIGAAPYFRDRTARGPFHLVPFDGHLNSEGHAMLAEVLADEMVARGVSAPARR
jgi:lysophospholipase L1-like esterase